MLTLLINLDRAPERMQRMEALMQKWNLSFERISAVDGTKFSSNDIENYRLPYHKRRYFLKDMTAGEIGCYLSHLEAWKRLVASAQEWALVLEDDLAFLRDPTPLLSNTDWIPEGVKLVQLARGYPAMCSVVRDKRVIPVSDTEKLMVVLEGMNGGTQGYFIHRDVAEELIKISTQVPAPSDDILFSFATPLRKKCTPWFLSPALIIPNDNGVTYVGRSKGKVKTSFSRGPSQYLGRVLQKFIAKFKSRIFGISDIR